MAVETLVNNPEFERVCPIEKEQTFLPVFPELLHSHYYERASPVEQYYLNHPSEAFSLRMRESFDQDGKAHYTATLKDSGTLQEQGLERIEVETEISEALYRYYQSPASPMLRKLRAHANRHVVIDFFEDGSVQVESEDAIAWTAFDDQMRTAFVDVTGDSQIRNEWKAHMAYRKSHQGQEALVPLPDLDPAVIASDILAIKRLGETCFVQITGRSGSGKSTIVNELCAQLAEYGLTSEVISTDDYHRGATWLSDYAKGEAWVDWDDPIVYNTEAMAQDLADLKAGLPTVRRQIDFTEVESKIIGTIQPPDVLIIEGIYASSPDFAEFADAKYEMPTPLATCIGRRLLRDIRERPQFADTRASLRYMLEYAEPHYRAQH